MNLYIFNSFIKSVFTIVYTYYILIKITNSKINNKIVLIVAFIILSLIYTVLKQYFNNIISAIFICFILVCFLQVIDNGRYTFILILISFAINLLFSGFAIVIMFIPYIMWNIKNTIILMFIINLIQGIMIFCFFKIKRFNKGILFLNDYLINSYLDMIIVNLGVIVILFYCLVGDQGNFNKSFIISFLILSLILIIMIQKTLTLYYKQKLLHQTIEDYKNEIAEKDKKIKELSDEKYKISKLNHEFYNRQKALEKKVSDFVSGLDTETAGEIMVVDKIEALSKEYSDKLQDIKHPDKLPRTDIEEIDDMFKYMQSECEKNKIEFKLQVNGNIHHMINKIIPKDKLVTLIGDHLRDAIIAINSSNNKFRSIFAIIGKTDSYYEFCVLDTGIEFEVETLLDLGTKPITTHKDTGGTGFGFMTTFETLKATKGSLEIEEKHKMNENDYTKAVKIIFDDKSQYRIKSYRLGTKEKNI